MTPEPTALRWLWIWITIAALVVLVVIGFLLGIAKSLESIDSGLAEASQSVEGAQGDTRPLPEHIQEVNASLVRVDQALEPLSEQATKVIGNLRDIRFTLQQVNGALESTSSSLIDTEGSLNNIEASLNDTEGSLNDTEGSLNDTERSLNDTSGELISAESGLNRIRGLADTIERRLELAQEFSSVGTNGIWRRVRFLNGGALFEDGERVDENAERGNTGLPLRRDNRSGLREVERDADGIQDSLFEVNLHLTSICEQLDPFAEFLQGPGRATPVLPNPLAPAPEPGTNPGEC